MIYKIVSLTSLMAQWVKNSPAVQETQEMWVWSLGWEYFLEEEMATYSGILPWEIPWTQESGWLQPMGSQESDTTEQLSTAQALFLYSNMYYYFIHLFNTYELGQVLCWTMDMLLAIKKLKVYRRKTLKHASTKQIWSNHNQEQKHVQNVIKTERKMWLSFLGSESL